MAVKTYTLNEVTEHLHFVIQQLNENKSRIDALDAWQAPMSLQELEESMDGSSPGDGQLVKSAIANLKVTMADFDLSDSALAPFGGFKA